MIKDVGSDLAKAIDRLSTTKQVKQLERNKAHPLKYLQLEHVNQVFGVQEVMLLPEPVVAPTYSHNHQVFYSYLTTTATEYFSPSTLEVREAVR